MSLGGWLVRPIVGLAGTGVGLVSSRAGQAITNSYDNIVGSGVVSGNYSPINWTYRAANATLDAADSGAGWAMGKIIRGNPNNSLSDRIANAAAATGLTRSIINHLPNWL